LIGTASTYTPRSVIRRRATFALQLQMVLTIGTMSTDPGRHPVGSRRGHILSRRLTMIAHYRQRKAVCRNVESGCPRCKGSCAFLIRDSISAIRGSIFSLQIATLTLRSPNFAILTTTPLLATGGRSRPAWLRPTQAIGPACNRAGGPPARSLDLLSQTPLTAAVPFGARIESTGPIVEPPPSAHRAVVDDDSSSIGPRTRQHRPLLDQLRAC
jgi:hypothetical protein